MKIINYILKRIVKYVDNISNSWYEFERDMKDYQLYEQYGHNFLNYDMNFINFNTILFSDKSSEIK